MSPPALSTPTRPARSDRSSRAGSRSVPDRPARRKAGPVATLAHLDDSGAARMVDVGEKKPTLRTAKAGGTIWMSRSAFAALVSGDAKKGDVLAAARVAAIAAAKRTWELIPLCHNLALESVAVEFIPDADECAVRCEVSARAFAKTGVEMEALTGAHIGLLTVYDMLKSADRAMVVGNIRLLEKRGGKSGVFVRSGEDDKRR